DLYIDVCDSKGRTPLSYAVRASTDSVVSQLLERGVRAHIHDHLGRSPLSYAASFSHEDSNRISYFLEKEGVQVNDLDHRNRSILSYAAASGGLETVEILLK